MDKAEQVRLRALVDELGTIELELKASDARAKIRRSDELKKDILQILDSSIGEELTAFGDKHVAIFGAVPYNRVVEHKNRLKRLLGLTWFINLAHFSIKDLETHLTGAQLATVTEKVQGTRHLKEVRQIK